MSERLRELLRLAAAQGASSVFFVVGNPPAIRAGGHVQPVPNEPRLRYQDTQPLAESLMSAEARAEFDAAGSVEIPFEVGDVRGRVHVYSGQGSHNLVFSIESR
jgi:Tfp pilus assembly pilus retraction ATPase PilT